MLLKKPMDVAPGARTHRFGALSLHKAASDRVKKGALRRHTPQREEGSKRNNVRACKAAPLQLPKPSLCRLPIRSPYLYIYRERERERDILGTYKNEGFGSPLFLQRIHRGQA